MAGRFQSRNAGRHRSGHLRTALASVKNFVPAGGSNLLCSTMLGHRSAALATDSDSGAIPRCECKTLVAHAYRRMSSLRARGPDFRQLVADPAVGIRRTRCLWDAVHHSMDCLGAGQGQRHFPSCSGGFRSAVPYCSFMDHASHGCWGRLGADVDSFGHLADAGTHRRQSCLFSGRSAGQRVVGRCSRVDRVRFELSIPKQERGWSGAWRWPHGGVDAHRMGWQAASNNRLAGNGCKVG